MNSEMEATRIPVINIKLKDEPATVFDSKVGGVPYWDSSDYPSDMIFLAQINFDDVPSLNRHGILQFFIGNDDDMGLFAQNFKVVFHEEPSEPVDVVPCESEFTPIDKPAKMEFEESTEIMSYSDFRFPLDDFDDSVYDNEEFSGAGSKLLGYPIFTQYDPREYDEALAKYNTLLFQLDSDDPFVCWGDVGVCNFFINDEKLAENDFSDVLYNWDCY
jgi:Uncharacterized protein conserved in bacteria